MRIVNIRNEYEYIRYSCRPLLPSMMSHPICIIDRTAKRQSGSLGSKDKPKLHIFHNSQSPEGTIIKSTVIFLFGSGLLAVFPPFDNSGIGQDVGGGTFDQASWWATHSQVLRSMKPWARENVASH